MDFMRYVGVYCSILLGFCFFLPAISAGEIAGEVVSVDGSVFIRPDGRVAGKLKPAAPGDAISAGDVVNTPSNGRVKILMKDKSIVDLGPSALFKVEGFKLNGGSDREADVSMMYGTMRAAVTQKIDGKGRFRVKTPAATMGVRGTEFIVKSEIKNMDEVRHVILNPDKPLPVQAAAAASAGSVNGKPGAAPAQPDLAKTEITVIQGQVDVKKELPKVDGRAPSSMKEEKVVSLTAGTQLTTKQGDLAPMKSVTLDTKQLASITKDIKVIDNTFSKAVVIDTSATSGSQAPSPEVMKAVMNTAVVAPPSMTVSMGDVGVAGTFGVTQTFTQQPVNTGPVLRRLKVIVNIRP
ncbi:MAG TPA: hypothetical protein DCS07_07245 [Bdellovibrionales bacterium]|nr:hypothetical protein [Bdellovibrionales bacterium]HCM40661.1 hypothetical protein [Bdellovibrionales bacterium]